MGRLYASAGPGPLRSAPAIADRPPVAGSSDLFRLLPYLLPYRMRWIAMIVVALVSLVATIAIPLMTKAVIDGPVRHQDQRGLWVLGIAALAVGISEAVLWFIRRWLVARATMGVEADIRKDLYARLQILPMSFHGRWQSGQLLSRVMNDLATIRRLLSFGLVFLLLNIIQITVVTAILLAMYWPLGVVVLVSIVPITLTVLHFEREFTRLSRQAQDQSGVLATHVEEAALGVRVVKSFGREQYVFDRFDEQASMLYGTQVRKVTVSAKFWTLLEVIPEPDVDPRAGLRRVRRRPRPGDDGNAGRVHHHDAVAGVADRVVGLPAVDDPGGDDGRQPRRRDLRRTHRDHRRPAHARCPRGGRLELVDVGYRFPDSRATRLGPASRQPRPSNRGRRWRWSARPDRASRCSPGCCRASTTSPRASSGWTASTSAICACPRCAGPWPPPSRIRRCSRCRCAENLRLGRPDASDDDLATAIDIAAAGFVHDLPFGLDTRIGEQGMSLSGGQRQRLSLARAIVAAPAILVLDDTLSALDVHTEAVVTEALRNVLRAVTGVVVANRASTVLLADRVALLENGTITHVGTHSELLATVPRYRYLLAADDELDDDLNTTSHGRATTSGTG